MRNTLLSLAFLAAALLPACDSMPVAGGDGDTLAIVGATVVHPEREGAAAVVPASTVIVRGHRIITVGPAQTTTVPAGATIIDGKGKWVIPGLVDSHVHFFQSGNLYTRPDAADFNAVVPYKQEVARNAARLPETFKVWLRSGVT